jgi:hypothetical protein
LYQDLAFEKPVGVGFSHADARRSRSPHRRPQSGESGQTIYEVTGIGPTLERTILEAALPNGGGKRGDGLCRRRRAVLIGRPLRVPWY